MDFVDEQNFGGVETAEGGGQVAGPFEGWAGGDSEAPTHLIGHDVGERGLAEAGGAAEENVIDGFFALPGRLDHEAKRALDAFLPDELIVGQVAGTEGAVKPLVAGA